MDQMQNFAKYGRVCPIICLVLALGIQLGIMVPYFGLAGISSNYNTYYTATYKDIDILNPLSCTAETEENADDLGYNYYDQCGFTPDWITEGEADKTSTGWTTAFKYNAIIYMILMIITVLMLCCMIIPGIPPAAVTAGTGCVVCFGTPLLAGAILSAVRVNSELGSACHDNISDISYLDASDVSADAATTAMTYTTFAMNGDAMKVLFIMQFVFLCPMQCCALCGGGIGSVVLTAAKMNDDGFNKAY